ncbi:hypothetical protein [Pollutibacter soli]|uniref:hypothetical protein n=1 Tax=Pollutibacter soli TaxID=3034157 RepID=UPI0030133D3A
MLKKLIAPALVYCLFLNTTNANAQVEMQVFGSIYPQQIKQYSEECLSLLNIQNQIRVNIFITDHLPYPYEGRTVRHAPDSAGIDQYSVYVQSGLKSEKQFLILAHELIHVKQYAAGLLDVTGDDVLWHGKRYYLHPDQLYSMPWENEAYADDDGLAKKFFTIRKQAQKEIREMAAINKKTSDARHSGR